MPFPSGSTGTLNIRLLGGFLVLVDNRRVAEDQYGRRKTKTLLKILALEPSHELHRDQLIELLWPEVEANVGQNNLHKVLHAARRALEPDLSSGAASRYLLTAEQRIQLRAPGSLRVDALEFAAAARSAIASTGEDRPALLRAALDLYTGELLPEDRYEDWVTAYREEVRHLYQETLSQLALTMEESSTEAAELWRKALAVDPCNEPAHRALMRHYASTGRRHLAANQYRTATEALRRELDAEVESATTELHQQILSSGSTATTPAPAEPRPEPAAPAPAVQAGTRLQASAGAFLVVVTLLAAVVAAGVFWYSGRRSSAAAAATTRSLAVLPFASDASLEFVSDGITESLIGQLSRLHGVRVMARSTVFTYKNMATKPNDAAKAMGVAAVVTGRLVQRGRELVVSAELVSGEDGARLWGQQYRIAADRVQTLQPSIASDIADALRVQLKDPERRRMGRSETPNSEAYRHYLLGRFHFNQRTESEYRKAIAEFEAAVAEDDRFAIAYSGLADAYGLLLFETTPTSKDPVQNGSDGSQNRPAFVLQSLAKARASAERALALDPDLAEAHTSLGMLQALYQWDWAGAERSFRRAIELNPGNATAHHWLGTHLAGQGREAEAKESLARALELDPLSRIILTNSGYPDYYARRYPEAIRAYQRAIDLDANFIVAHTDLSLAYEKMKRWDEAGRELVMIAKLQGPEGLSDEIAKAPDYPKKLEAVKRAFTGRYTRSAGYTSPILLAQICARLGQVDEAFVWLDRAVEERNGAVVYLKVDPVYDSLRTDRRFQAILTRIGL